MKDFPYLYVSPDSNTSSQHAVIVLPEIYGLNDFVRSVADRAAQELGAIGVGLDHFYAVDNQVHTIGYDEHEKGVELMQAVTGETYLSLLGKTIDSIFAKYPSVVDITVLGFCFGGKLAYLSGVDERVNTIVSFYGGASLASDFYRGKSAVQALAEARQDDTNLRVVGLFGEQDELISEGDRQGVHDELARAHIPCEIAVFSAGHAFFNQERSDRYSEAAAQEAWKYVLNFFAVR
jgi:carboxymethylenebutenolidase